MSILEKDSVSLIRRERRNVAVFIALAITIVLTIILRLWGIESRSLSHPEIYVPGIHLVPDISEPTPTAWALPQRSGGTFMTSRIPMGWYVAMLGWTKTFGTSHLALRFPGVLFALEFDPADFLDRAERVRIDRRMSGCVIASDSRLPYLHGARWHACMSQAPSFHSWQLGF